MSNHPSQTSRRVPRGGLALFAVVSILIPLGYIFSTDQIWEDYFITFRHSQNLCEGKGLVFNPPERVHGFTSPLGVLLPALFHRATGMKSYLPALWLFRITSIIAFAGGGTLVLRAMRPEGGPAGLFFAILYLANIKAVAFSTNGMETAFMLLFLAWNIHLFTRDDPRDWRAVGICWAALMWTRPDSFLYIATLATANLIFGRQPRRSVLSAYAKSALVCTIIYLPWFAWAWNYYGSPIPHTVLAKANQNAGPWHDLELALRDPLRYFDRYLTTASLAWQPIYGEFYKNDQIFKIIILYRKIIGLFCATYWLIPLRDDLGRACSFSFAVLCCYLSFAPPFPWYYPPLAMLGSIVLSRGFLTLADTVPRRRPLGKRVAILALLLIGVEQVVLFGLTAQQMKIQQEEIEFGNRLAIGLWLRDNVRAGENIYLEPIGYIGYFSGATIDDWPGLVSPRVVKLRREQKLDFFMVPAALKPDWLVLRPGDAGVMAKAWPFRENYALIKVFDVSEKIIYKYRYFNVSKYILTDSCFEVYRRKHALPGRPGE